MKKTQDELEEMLDLWAAFYNKEQQFIDKQASELTLAGYGPFMLFEEAKFNETQWKKKVDTKVKGDRKEGNSCYYVNKAGLPIREEMYLHNGELFAVIYFEYTVSHILTVRYGKRSKYPEAVRKLEQKKGKVQTYYSFSINGARSHHNEAITTKEYKAELRNDSGTFWWSTEQYLYNEAGKVEKVFQYVNAAGIGLRHGVRFYEYDDKGLKKTFTKWNDGQVDTDYFRKPPDFKTADFLSYLASLFVVKIIKATQELQVSEPVSIMNISFQNVYNYWPYITYATEREVEDFTATEPATDFFFFVTLNRRKLDIKSDKELEEQFAILENMTRSNIHSHYGERMWSMVAKNLNNTYLQYNRFSSSFFAYAGGDMDYDLKKNLKDSGATKEQLNAWTKKGYI